MNMLDFAILLIFITTIIIFCTFLINDKIVQQIKKLDEIENRIDKLETERNIKNEKISRF